MAKKVYAVRKGLKTGIFNSWDECKIAVTGFSGAEYKGFNDEEEATRWLNYQDDEGISMTAPKQKVMIPISDTECNVFTDGSYKDGFASFGIYIQTNRTQLKFCGSVDCRESFGSMQNVLGELLAVYVAMELISDMNLNKINLYYDFEGIHSWASGAWKCNGELQSHYAIYIQNLINRGAFVINFKKVKGHSGVEGNVIADALARRGRTEGKVLPVSDVINGNVKCKDVHLVL